MQSLREAELQATQIAQAWADAQRLKIDAEATAEAEAIRIMRVAEAQAEAIRQVNAAIAEGGEAYFALRQLELIPQITPYIANALTQARMVNIASDGKSAAGGAAEQITSVIQTVLAAQLVTGTLTNNPPTPASVPRRDPPQKPVVPAVVPAIPNTAVIQTSGPQPPSFEIPRGPVQKQDPQE